METVQKTYSFPKEIHEIGEAVKSILESSTLALKDGWQPGQDIPVIMTTAFASLMSAVEGIQKVPSEISEAPILSFVGSLLPIAEGIQTLMKKDA
jgi:hypothetical protein